MALQKSILALQIATEIGRVDLASDAEGWYDTALNIILDAHLWSFLICITTRATVVGVQRYGLPNNFREHESLVYEVTDADQWKLSRVPMVTFRRRYAGASDSRPQDFSILGPDVFLGPPPSEVATLRLDYYIVHPPVASGETSLFPKNIEEVQRLYMLWRGYDSLRESEKARDKLRMAEVMLGRAVGDDQDRDNDEVFLQQFIAQPVIFPGEYWKNPFVGIRR